MTASRRFVALDDHEAEAAMHTALEEAAYHDPDRPRLADRIVAALNEQSVDLCRNLPAAPAAARTPEPCQDWKARRIAHAEERMREDRASDYWRGYMVCAVSHPDPQPLDQAPLATFPCKSQQAGEGRCGWPTCGCGDPAPSPSTSEPEA